MSINRHSKIDPYCTHFPYLARAVQLFGGPVLEVGCGDYSTWMLHLMCKETKLLSIETDPDWLDMFVRLADDRHKFSLCRDVDELLAAIGGCEWAVVFPDSETWDIRIATMNAVKETGAVVVAHDIDQCGYKDARPLFKYVREFNWLPRGTAIMSNREGLVEMF